jgi:hypothetical protein
MQFAAINPVIVPRVLPYFPHFGPVALSSKLLRKLGVVSLASRSIPSHELELACLRITANHHIADVRILPSLFDGVKRGSVQDLYSGQRDSRCPTGLKVPARELRTIGRFEVGHGDVVTYTYRHPTSACKVDDLEPP